MLRPLYIEVRSLEQAQENILHIVAHITGLRQSRGIGNGEGNL